MATGKQAFPGSTSAEVFDAILNRAPVAPVRLNPAVPTKLEEIIRKALEKDPKLRYQHTSDLRSDLHRLKRDTDTGRSGSVQAAAAIPATVTGIAPAAVHDTGSSAISAVAQQHKGKLVVGAVVIVLLLVGAGYGVYSLLNAKRAAPFEDFTITQVTDNGKSVAAAISPDGKYILIVEKDKGMQSLWLHHVPTNSDTQVIPPSDDSYRSPRFSVDGNYIYFRKAVDKTLTSFNLYRAPVLGGTPQAIGRDIDSGVTFSPDGKRMAYMRANDPEVGKYQVLTANVDGSDEKVVAKGPASDAPESVTWSPNGKQMAEIASLYSGDVGAVKLLELASGNSRSLAESMSLILTDGLWVPDGHGLLVISYSNRLRSQVGFIPTPAGQFRAVTKDTNSYRTLTLSADGKTLATVQQKYIETFSIVPSQGFTGNPPSPALAQNNDSFHPSWASNGDLYFNGSALLRISTDGSNKTTLLSDPNATVAWPSACPGGRYVVFAWAGHVSGQNATIWNIWRVDTDGSNQKQLTYGKLDWHPECSPDGKWVYFSDAAESRVMRVSVDGGTPEQVPGAVSNTTDSRLALSPDGKLLAFLPSILDAATQTSSVKLVLVNLDANTKTTPRLVDVDPRAGQHIQFTPDGKAVTYVIKESGVDNLWIQPLDGTRGRQITYFSSDYIDRFQYSPDGKSLAIEHLRIESDVVLLRDTGASPH